MARLEQAEIDRIRSNADIVDVISHYISVQKHGRQYRCICPFHDDHDPSLKINTDRQIYKCFVCGAGGNVFTFVQNYEKVSFVEAVSAVASITNQSLTFDPTAYEKPADPHVESIHKVLQETIRYTSYQLDTADGSAAKDYLEKRGLDKTIRDTFEIGFNPTGNALSRYLSAKGYSQQQMVDANVVNVYDGKMRDVFEGRITFPIHDANGKPIGFSARTMDPSDPSKYVNTNETDVFHKGNIVYNYHRARPYARHDGKMYVCEGVTDVIAFGKAGINNAVCTLGTSCTAAQIALLKRSAARIVFCYDGDHAGQAATFRAGKMAVESGCEISIVVNQTGKDPDEIVTQDGAEGLNNLVSRQISWMEFVLSYLESETNMSSYLDKKEMADKAMAEIERLADPMERQYFTSKLAEMTGLPLKLRDRDPIVVRDKSGAKAVIPDGLRNAEDQILSMMLVSNDAVRKFEDEIGYLITREGQMLAMMIIDDVHTKGSCDPASLMDQTEDEALRSRIVSIASEHEWMNDYDASRMDGAMRSIRIRLLDDEAAQYRDQLTQALNGTAMATLMQKYNECLNMKRKLIDEENKAQ